MTPPAGGPTWPPGCSGLPGRGCSRTTLSGCCGPFASWPHTLSPRPRAWSNAWPGPRRDSFGWPPSVSGPSGCASWPVPRRCARLMPWRTAGCSPVWPRSWTPGGAWPKTPTTTWTCWATAWPARGPPGCSWPGGGPWTGPWQWRGRATCGSRAAGPCS